MPGQVMKRLAHRGARAPRAVVLGEIARTGEIVSRLSCARTAEILTSRALADVIIMWHPDPATVRDVALWAVRTCPHTAIVIAAPDGLALCREAARASGLSPALILPTGGIPHSSMEARRLAARIDVSVRQVFVPVIGGGEPAVISTIHRYATVAGIAVDAMDDPGPSDWPSQVSTRAPGEEALISATVTLARAVLEDKRQVLCCGAWIEGAWGISGAFVIAPVPVGASGAGEPLPMTLTLEQQALLQRSAIFV